MRTTLTSVGDLLFGQTRGRILTLLYGASSESFYVRQIARQIETSAGSVQRELGLLTGAGLIERSALGVQVFYRANREHPVFKELSALLAQTTGIFHLLKMALASLSDRIDFAFVFGSVARGEDKASSDIDLMVVGAVSLDEILDAASSAEEQLRRPLSPTIYSLQDLREKFHAGNHFLRSLENAEKVFLIGDEDGFREACRIRLVQG